MEGLPWYIATGIVSLVVGYLLTYLQPAARVVYWLPNNFLFRLTEQNVILQTDSLTAQNLGRREAGNVEIILDRRPDFFEITPAIQHNEEDLENGHFVLRFPTLGPKEFFTVQLLSYTQVPRLLNIRSNSGQARSVPVQLYHVFSKPVSILRSVLILVGVGFSIYWLVKGFIFISKEIGIM